MVFCFDQKVLFKHCDPAGIVFYPRYFEMMSDCVEAFFDHIGHPFELIHVSGGVPTAKIETQFLRPSRHGDLLHLDLNVTKVGNASMSLSIRTKCASEDRVHFTATLVNVDNAGKPSIWSRNLRAAFTPYLKSEI